MAQKPSPDTTQPIEDSQLLPAGAQSEPPAIPRDPDVSGWLGLPLRSDDFAPARPAARSRRLGGWWLLLGLAAGGAVATGLAIWSPWSAPTPMPVPAQAPSVTHASDPAPAPAPAADRAPEPVTVPAAAALSSPPVVHPRPATTEGQKIRRSPATKHKKAVVAKKRASRRP